VRVLHLNAGNETGGGMHHLLLLLGTLNKEEFTLGVFEEGELSKRAKALGIDTVVFKQSSQFDLSITKRISEYIKENQIDFVHTHGPRANLFGAFLKKTGTFKKWITTLHSDPRDDFLGQGTKGKIFTKLNIWAIKKADHYFAISDRFKTILIDFNIKESKITTILNGIKFDVQSSAAYKREDFNLKHTDLVAIMVARLEKVKDHMTALKALKYAVDKNSSIRLILVGEGNEKEEIIKMIQTLELTNHVLLLGHRQDVIDLYPLADLSLLTSKSESFPLVLLEAARAKIPAISTNVGGVNKMIPSDNIGWIVNVKDAEQVGSCLLKAFELKKDNKLSSMGDEFYQFCSTRYAIEHQASAIYTTYKELLQSEANEN
jgi:L-malate glycosyltransferase